MYPTPCAPVTLLVPRGPSSCRDLCCCGGGGVLPDERGAPLAVCGTPEDHLLMPTKDSRGQDDRHATRDGLRAGSVLFQLVLSIRVLLKTRTSHGVCNPSPSARGGRPTACGAPVIC